MTVGIPASNNRPPLLSAPALPPAPGWLCKLFPFISVCLVVLAIIMVLLITHDTSQFAAYTKLEQALGQSNYSRSSQHLMNLLNTPRVTRLLHLASQFNNQRYTQKYHKAVLTAHKAVSNLESNKVDEAIKQFGLLKLILVQESMADHAHSEASPESLNDLERLLIYYQQQHNNLLTRSQTIPRRIDLHKRQLQQHELFAIELNQEIANFFSLKLDAPEGALPPYYEEGVLQDLPRLVGLPDNIPDLISLRKELEGIGGSVDLKGVEAPEQFQVKLGEYRQVSGLYRQRLAEFASRNERLEQDLNNMRLAVHKGRQQLQQRLVALLLEITRPSYHPCTKLALSLFRVHKAE